MKKNEDSYELFSEYYDIVISETLQSEINFLDSLFKLFGKNIKNILDLGCGTATHAVSLEKIGYRITCCDISDSMLKIAKQKIEKSNSKIRLFKHDMKTIRINGKFDAAIALSRAFQHMMSDSDVKKTLRNISNHLKLGGLFVCELHNYQSRKHGIYSRMVPLYFSKNHHKKVAIFGIDDEDYTKRIAQRIYLLLKQKSNKTSFDFNSMNFRIWSVDEMKIFLGKEGFDILDVYGDFDLNQKFTEQSDTMIFVCKKVK